MVSENSLLRSTYTLADYLFTLYLLYYHRHMGRYGLAKKLNISNSQARNILEKLVDAKLVEKSSQQFGHKLTPLGQEIWNGNEQFLRISNRHIYLGKNYTIGKKDAVVCVEGTGIDQLNTVILRDESLLNGALGCTVFLKVQSGKFYLLDAVYPPLPHTAISDRKTRKKLLNVTLGIPWSELVIIVGTADHLVNARIGAISAALLLIPEKLRNYFQKLD